MDYNCVENLIREDIKNKCPQLTNEIIEEYLDLTFFRSSWVTYGDNKDIYLVGIAEGKYDFYYVGFDDNQNLELISCALDIKPNKKGIMILYQNLIEIFKVGVMKEIEFGRYIVIK